MGLRIVILGLISLFLLSCGGNNPLKKRINYDSLSAITEEGHINIVVEIPAGTNTKIEFDKNKQQFLPDQKDGKDRIIDFLPYPGNYGYIPGTLMDEEKGGDGDALDVLLIGPALETGRVVQAQPIATLLLSDSGEIDTKLIAIPVDESMRAMKVNNFQEFLIEYDAAKRIVEEWFTHYKGHGVVQFLGWEDDKYAWNEIKKWIVEE